MNAYASESNTLIIKVEGMTCNHCKMNVENSIRRLEFVESVEANVSKNTVSISGKI
ncbi:MAG: cation transporter [Bacteroidales bacterium]